MAKATVTTSNKTSNSTGEDGNCPSPMEQYSNVQVSAVEMEQFPTVQQYLNVEVSAVELPAKVESRETYPFLVLDGSSGVGKTQAFFLF